MSFDYNGQTLKTNADSVLYFLRGTAYSVFITEPVSLQATIKDNIAVLTKLKNQVESGSNSDPFGVGKLAYAYYIYNNIQLEREKAWLQLFKVFGMK